MAQIVRQWPGSACPIVQAMTPGQAGYHFTKPWLQDLYRAVLAERDPEIR